MLSFVELKVMFFRLIDDFILHFFQNLAVSFRKFVIRQNVDVIDEVDEI